jgi:hypothetical protein
VSVAVGRVIRAGGLGFLILGIGGRLTMALFSALTPFPVGFTWKGSFTVAVTGALYGLGAGAIAGALPAWRSRRPTLVDGAILGLVVLAIIAAVSTGLRQVSAARAFPALAIVLFAPLAVTFGVVLARTEPTRPNKR